MGRYEHVDSVCVTVCRLDDVPCEVTAKEMINELQAAINLTPPEFQSDLIVRFHAQDFDGISIEYNRPFSQSEIMQADDVFADTNRLLSASASSCTYDEWVRRVRLELSVGRAEAIEKILSGQFTELHPLNNNRPAIFATTNKGITT